MTTHVDIFSDYRGTPINVPLGVPPEEELPQEVDESDPLSDMIQRRASGATPATAAAPPPAIQGGDWTVFDLLSGGVYDEEKRPDPGQYYVTDEQAKTGALDEFHDDVPLPWLGMVSAIFRDQEEQADVTRKSLEIMGVSPDVVSFGDDEKGHFMNLKLKSGKSIKKYFNQKGVSKADVTGFAGDLAMFAPGAGWAARGASTVGKLVIRNALAEGSTEALRQGIEKLMGGEFNAGDVAAASTGGAIGAGIAGAPFAIAERRLRRAMKGKTKSDMTKLVDETPEEYGLDNAEMTFTGRRSYLNEESLDGWRQHADELKITERTPAVEEVFNAKADGRVPGGILPQVRKEIQLLSKELNRSKDPNVRGELAGAQLELMMATLNRIFKGAGSQTSESQFRQAKVFMGNLHKISDDAEINVIGKRDVRRGMTHLYNIFKRPRGTTLLRLSRVMETRTLNNYLKWAAEPQKKDRNLVEHSLWQYYKKVSDDAQLATFGDSVLNKDMRQTIVDDLAAAQQQFLSWHLDPSIVTATMSKLDAAETIANNIDKIFSGKGQDLARLDEIGHDVQFRDSTGYLMPDGKYLDAPRGPDEHPDLRESVNVLFGDPWGMGRQALDAGKELRKIGNEARRIARMLKAKEGILSDVVVRRHKRATRDLDLLLHRIGSKVNLIHPKKRGTSLKEIVPQALDALAPLAPGGGALARWARGRVKRYEDEEQQGAEFYKDLTPKQKFRAEFGLFGAPPAYAAGIGAIHKEGKRHRNYDPFLGVEEAGDKIGDLLPTPRFKGNPPPDYMSQSYRLLSKRFPHLEAAGLL